VRNKVTLQLTGDLTGSKVVYKDLEFKIDQLKRLQTYHQKGMPLQFVHIYPKANTLYVAKPFRKEEFISISSVEIFNPQHSGY
jgi:hypothetical protein